MFDKVMMLQNMLIGHATGSMIDEELYIELRKELIEDPALKSLVPEFVRKNRSAGALWGHFKSISPQWQPRREHIWAAFGPMLDYLEKNNKAPGDGIITDSLASFDLEG